MSFDNTCRICKFQCDRGTTLCNQCFTVFMYIERYIGSPNGIIDLNQRLEKYGMAIQKKETSSDSNQ